MEQPLAETMERLKINRGDMSQKEIQIILGTMLGDGHMFKQKFTRNHGKRYPINANPLLRLNHGPKQVEYMEWKMQGLPHLHFCKITECTTRNKKYNKIYKHYMTTSTTHPFLNQVYDMLYGGKKHITRHYLNKLDALGLAVWWMDDGSLIEDTKSKNARGWLNTYVSFDENLIIVRYLRKVWKINCHIARTNNPNLFRIDLPKSAVARMIEIIRQHVEQIPCMKYKVSLSNNIEHRFINWHYAEFNGEDIVRTAQQCAEVAEMPTRPNFVSGSQK